MPPPSASPSSGSQASQAPANTVAAQSGQSTTLLASGSTASDVGSSTNNASTSKETLNPEGRKKDGGPKKRKVGQACVYCRRSHMTCDSARPCKRCVKRDIGHLCHDETPGKGHGHAHHAMPKPKSQASSTDPSHAAAAKPPPAHAPGAMPPPALPASQTPTGFSSPAGTNQNSGANAGRLDTLQAYISALSQATSGSTTTSPYPGQQPSALASKPSMDEREEASRSHSFFRAGADLSGSEQPLGGLSQETLGGLALGTPSSAHAPVASSVPEARTLTPDGAVPPSAVSTWPAMTPSAAGLGGAGFLGLGGSDGLMYGGTGGGGDVAGGNEFNLLSEFLESLDGGGDPASSDPATNALVSHNDVTGAASTAGIESSWASSPRQAIANDDAASTFTGAQSPRGRKRPRDSPMVAPLPATEGDSKPSGPQMLPAGSSSASPMRSTGANGAIGANGAAASGKGAYAPPSLKGFSTKTEKFFLTAADQVDGPRDERLSRVIQAKYDAGLLRPYNHVKGYARLSSWMDRNVSPASRRRILKPLSIFRPRFRAVAQSLSDIDLIYIEEAFERLLLDYDRVFSTQGIPACLWRRTGEIYKGNREFAELVGVGIEELREGQMGIYELMEEESACNYWEKYGAVSFDPGQKAVLTSCVLTVKQGFAAGGTFARPSAPNTGKSLPATRDGSFDEGNKASGLLDSAAGKDSVAAAETAGSTTKIHCCFSFTIRRDTYGCPILVVGNFLPTD